MRDVPGWKAWATERCVERGSWGKDWSESRKLHYVMREEKCIGDGVTGKTLAGDRRSYFVSEALAQLPLAQIISSV